MKIFILNYFMLFSIEFGEKCDNSVHENRCRNGGTYSEQNQRGKCTLVKNK